MTTFLSPRRGASLLTILLLIAVVGSLVLAASRALLDSGRAAATLSAQAEARSISKTALAEGWFYLNTSSPVLATCDGELGTCADRTLTQQYSLAPIKRGWKANTDPACSDQTAAEAANAVTSLIDPSCPRYDLAIRTRAAYTTKEQLADLFKLSSRDFPNGQPMTIAYRAPQLVTFQVSNSAAIQGVAYRLCATESSCALPVSGSAPRGGSFSINDTGLSARFIQLTVTYTTPPADPITILTASMGVDTPVVIGTGFKAIEATGYAGDVIVRSLGVLRGDGTRYQSEISQAYNTNGIFAP